MYDESGNRKSTGNSDMCEMRLIEWDEPDRMNQGVDSNDEVAWCLIYIKEDVGGRQIEQGLQPRAL